MMSSKESVVEGPIFLTVKKVRGKPFMRELNCVSNIWWCLISTVSTYIWKVTVEIRHHLHVTTNTSPRIDCHTPDNIETCLHITPVWLSHNCGMSVKMVSPCWPDYPYPSNPLCVLRQTKGLRPTCHQQIMYFILSDNFTNGGYHTLLRVKDILTCHQTKIYTKTSFIEDKLQYGYNHQRVLHRWK